MVLRVYIKLGQLLVNHQFVGQKIGAQCFNVKLTADTFKLCNGRLVSRNRLGEPVLCISQLTYAMPCAIGQHSIGLLLRVLAGAVKGALGGLPLGPPEVTTADDHPRQTGGKGRPLTLKGGLGLG